MPDGSTTFDAGACVPTGCGFTLAQLGSPVTLTYNAGAVPPLTGGTFVEGTYVLTAETKFGTASGPAVTETQTFRSNCGTSYVSVDTSTAVLGGMETRTIGSFTPSTTNAWGETISFCDSMNDAGVPLVFPNFQYTATATTLSVYVPTDQSLHVYTKRP